MKRLFIPVLALALLVLGGCTSNTEVESPEVSSGVDTQVESPATIVPEGLEAMPTDGPGESAAVAALPGALEEAKAMRETAGLDWPDLDGVEPIFTSYLVAVDMDGQTALFEVRADGKVHSLYAYQKAFDAGTMVWSPSDMSTSPRSAPRSAAEQSVTAAVESAMRDSFPDSQFAVSIYGYRFTYLRDGENLLMLEIATDGSVISV